MAETLTIDFSKPIPLFPLPQCLLLPHATIPLHIFEPRYRQMVSDALDSQGLIAMASFEGEDWKSDYEGSPPIREYVCVGYIVKHDLLPDGRYNILLQGVCRARVVEELDSQEPYRTAVLEPIEPQPPPMEIDLVDHREQIESLLSDPLLKDLASVSAIHNWLSSEVPTTALIDLAIMTTCESTRDRYRLLAEPSVNARAQWLEKMLRDTRKSLATAQRFNPGSLADGVNLN